jgi:hypothetical protein
MTTVIIKKEQEYTISRGGNSSILYLSKEYFTPGEKVNSQLEIDLEGNLKMVLTKRLFNFTCDSMKALVGSNFAVDYDKTIAGTQIFSATKDNLTINCTKSTIDLEPTYVTVSKHIDQVKSSADYSKLLSFVKSLTDKDFDAYVEPEGDIDSLKIYKEPQRHKLKDEFEAIDALSQTGKKMEFSIVIRFNSKKNNADQVKAALKEIAF